MRCKFLPATFLLRIVAKISEYPFLRLLLKRKSFNESAISICKFRCVFLYQIGGCVRKSASVAESFSPVRIESVTRTTSAVFEWTKIFFSLRNFFFWRRSGNEQVGVCVSRCRVSVISWRLSPVRLYVRVGWYSSSPLLGRAGGGVGGGGEAFHLWENVVRFFGELLTPLIRQTTAVLCAARLLRLFFSDLNGNKSTFLEVGPLAALIITRWPCYCVSVPMTMAVWFFFSFFLFGKKKYANLAISLRDEWQGAAVNEIRPRWAVADVCKYANWPMSFYNCAASGCWRNCSIYGRKERRRACSRRLIYWPCYRLLHSFAYWVCGPFFFKIKGAVLCVFWSRNKLVAVRTGRVRCL